MSSQECQATPGPMLRNQIMSATAAKSEAEWWAHRHIAELEGALRRIASYADHSAAGQGRAQADAMRDIAREALER